MANMCVSFVFGLMFALHMGPSFLEAAPELLDYYTDPEYNPVDGEVLFDSSTYNLVKETTEVKMPESCGEKSFCFDKGANYPDDKIAYLLKDIRNLKVDDHGSHSSMGNRNGDIATKDCPEDFTKEPIYYITDTDGNVRVVVQLKDKFEQIYTVRWCRNPGRITEDSAHFVKNTTLSNFNIQCVDAKMDFDFFVLRDEMDPETGKPAPKMELAKVKGGGIPVCCRCQYEQLPNKK